MRTLLLFRGAPGCGKSTYIKTHGLEPYALSADTIRLQCSSPVQLVTGGTGISQKNDKLVWDMLFKMLECRMQAGCFTVIDATNSKTTEMNRYKALAKQYRYRIYVVDMTDLPIAECKRRNANREESKRVPEAVIDKMYARFATQKIPAGLKVLTPDNAMDEIAFRKEDFSQYESIYVIGDIHGCNTCLQDFIGSINGLMDDTLYIFCGDYIDRGLENAEVIRYLLSIKDKPNVILLEGNHERWLYCWSHDQPTRSQEFERRTRRELDESGLDKKDVSRLYQRLHQCVWFTYRGNDFFVSHGGIAPFNQQDLIKIPTFQMIHGVGNYEDVPALLEAWSGSDMVNIFGHRNIQDYPVQPENTHCCLLEGGIEYGGNLRAVRIVGEAVLYSETKNEVYRQQEEPQKPIAETPIADLVDKLRHNRNVKESKFGNVSAFNFTARAFQNGIWNNETTLARGLFIDTSRNEIAARGYEKFFRIDELARTYRNPDGTKPSSSIEYLKQRLKFPVTAYVKENGYLGLVSYDKDADDLRFCTKGSIGGEYAENFKEIFMDHHDESIRRDMAEYLRDNNCTLLFEVVDQKFDPHIIDYTQQMLVLLDCVKNEIEFKKLPYNELCSLARKFNLPCKAQLEEEDFTNPGVIRLNRVTFNDWPSFYDFYLKASAPGYTYLGDYIEGFVFEDAAGFMTKLKTDYYSKWKHMRSVADSVRRWGYIQNTAQLTDAVENAFYGFLREKYNQDENFRNYKQQRGYDIITLRKQFFAERGEPV